jgi:hypothetical protein
MLATREDRSVEGHAAGAGEVARRGLCGGGGGLMLFGVILCTPVSVVGVAVVGVAPESSTTV